MATVLVVGATGMTGLPLVEQLLACNHKVRIIVRSSEKIPAAVLKHSNLTIIEGSVLDLTEIDITEYVKNCDAVVSCLGHVLSFQGMFGEPKNLCTEAARRLCSAIGIHNSMQSTKFILMNTVGVKNTESDKKRIGYERALLWFLSHTIPPQRDNEMAAEYLQKELGKRNPQVEWCVVRPDSLINADVSPYEIQAAPSTGIFSGRPTTRANVARFMLELIEDSELWAEWKFKMPVVMNLEC